MSFFRFENANGMLDTLRSHANEAAGTINNFLSQPRHQMQVYTGNATVLLGCVGVVSGIVDSLANPGNIRSLLFIVGGALLAVAGGISTVLDCHQHPVAQHPQDPPAAPVQEPENPPVVLGDEDQHQDEYRLLVNEGVPNSQSP